jgi:hypothetical protein
LAKTISDDLRAASETLETLVNNWHIDEQTGQSFTPNYNSGWTAEMIREHDQYKKYDRQQKTDITDFKNYFKNNCTSNHDPTIQEFKELRRLAIKWAENATMYVIQMLSYN